MEELNLLAPLRQTDLVSIIIIIIILFCDYDIIFCCE